MGNKTNVIQKVYDRISRLTNYGVKEVRVGSVETSRKHTDLPIVWVNLESGREAGNYQNGAAVDAMRVSLNILENKLKLTNNTLFRVPSNGGGDIYTIGDEVDVNVNDGMLDWFNALNTRLITTSDGVNGAEMITSGVSVGFSSMMLSVSANSTQDQDFLEFIAQLQYRALTIGDSVCKVLCNTSALSGFSYNGLSLGEPVDIDFEGGIFALLPNIKKHTLTITDYWGNSKSSFTVYTYNTGESVTGGTATLGTPGEGALILLEKALDQIDLDDSGVADIGLSSFANNRRDIDYTMDTTGDYVFIQAFVGVESSIFRNGNRSG